MYTFLNLERHSPSYSRTVCSPIQCIYHKSKLKIFGGIKELALPLDDLCVLIGENNSGKSTILDAVRICLTSSLTGPAPIFEDYDDHLPTSDSEPSTAEPIEIRLTFSEKYQGEWSKETKRLLVSAVNLDGSITNRLDRTNGFS